MRFYFDHNACTPVDPRVLARFQEVEAQCPGNPGSPHQAGRRARGVVESARDAIADCLRVDADAVFFVSGGTEANNLAILGVGDLSLPVLCAAAEHPSVFRAAEQRGLVPWPVDRDGRVIPDAPDQAIGMIALVHGQNEVGTLQPVEEAGTLARTLEVPLHVDASQTLGRCPLDDVLAAAETITLSTHKAAGLRGMAVLIDRGDRVSPMFFGGAQQRERRPGTESPSLAAATALTVQLAIDEQEDRAQAMAAARDAFWKVLAPDAKIRRRTPDASLPNTLMVQFDGIDGRQLLPALDMAGVEASQGSACSSGSPLPPPILQAMGLDADEARACVRFSFSPETSVDDATAGARIVLQVVRRLRAD